MQNDAKKWLMRDFQGNSWIKKFRRSCTSSAKRKEFYDGLLVILINFQELHLHINYANKLFSRKSRHLELVWDCSVLSSVDSSSLWNSFSDDKGLLEINSSKRSILLTVIVAFFNTESKYCIFCHFFILGDLMWFMRNARILIKIFFIS